MIIKINGKEEILEKKATIADLVKNKNLNPDEIVIEHNRKVINKVELEKIVLQHDDIVEILTFVGGG